VTVNLTVEGWTYSGGLGVTHLLRTLSASSPVNQHQPSLPQFQSESEEQLDNPPVVVRRLLVFGESSDDFEQGLSGGGGTDSVSVWGLCDDG
jgi:hypothetical protein